MVSDDAETVYLVDRDGKLIDAILIDTPQRDWEGVAELPTGELAIVSEVDRHVLLIDPNTGGITQVLKVSDMTDDPDLVEQLHAGGENKGLEAITTTPDGSIWIAKEAEPMLLIRAASRHRLDRPNCPGSSFLAQV